MWRSHIWSLPGLTEEMIERSGEMPISLYWEPFIYRSIREEISDFPPILDESLDLGMAESYRVSDIHLQEVGEYIVGAFYQATDSAPILQSMNLSDLSHKHDWEDACALPPSTFAGHAPNLRRLVLDHIACPQGILHNVTHLSISRGALGSSCAQILDSLCAMPMLEELEITEFSLQWSNEVVWGDRIVKLPSLRRLVISGTQFFCLWLPQSISIPSTSSFVLGCTETLRRSPRWPLILPHSSSISSDTDSVVVALDRIHVRLEELSILVKGWNLTIRPGSTQQSFSANIGPDADISVEFIIRSVDYCEMISLLFKALHLQQVRTLRLSAGRSLDVETLPRSLLTKMPALESCVVERSFVAPFVKALNSSVGDDVGMSLTGLDELELMGHGFVEEAEAKVAENLLAYAAARDRMGGGMKVIRFRDCEDMDAMWLEALGRVVGKIECCKTPSRSYY